MKKLLLTLTLAASLVGARSASAAQETIKIKENSCYATYGTPSYNQWGVLQQQPQRSFEVELPRPTSLAPLYEHSIVGYGLGPEQRYQPARLYRDDHGARWKWFVFQYHHLSL